MVTGVLNQFVSFDISEVQTCILIFYAHFEPCIVCMVSLSLPTLTHLLDHIVDVFFVRREIKVLLIIKSSLFFRGFYPSNILEQFCMVTWSIQSVFKRVWFLLHIKALLFHFCLSTIRLLYRIQIFRVSDGILNKGRC